MREQFKEQSFYASSRKLIEQANQIGLEYIKLGYSLTLRQLYYQFVARDLLKNTVNNYKRLGSIINDARLAGLLDWDLIEDRTRWLRQIPNYLDPQDFLENVIRNYAEDLWRDQPFYCEVWIEKDALSGVIANICNEWRVPYFPCRGYASQSEVYQAGKRLEAERIIRRRDGVVIFHLGDHDPSGIDMTRDNADRLSMFARMPVEIRRLALNMDQVEQYDPPENPAKETDSRFADYADKFGDSSWELDALEPTVITELVGNAIESVVDVDDFEQKRDMETANRERLQEVADRWEDVAKFLRPDEQM